MVECWTCNRELAGSNLTRGYSVPTPTPYAIIPPLLVNKYQRKLGSKRQWLNSAGMGRNGIPPPVSGVPPPEIAVPPPKVVVPPPGNGRSVTIWGKTIKTVATRRQILRLKCTKYYFGWGSTPDPAGGDYSACPEPLERASLLLRGMGGREGKRRGND